MYGRVVHEAVIAHQEKESGITIHYVDEQYDHGDIIFQHDAKLILRIPGTLQHELEYDISQRLLKSWWQTA
jgi:phosphoribosylglycinamide formyltransferase-1